MRAERSAWCFGMALVLALAAGANAVAETAPPDADLLEFLGEFDGAGEALELAIGSVEDESGPARTEPVVHRPDATEENDDANR